MRISNSIWFGSHLPMLLKTVISSTGPILELGAGPTSTPFLHWLCYEKKRPLYTYENNPDMRRYLRQFRSDFHVVGLIDDWNKVDLSFNWSMALVDHAPNERRVEEVKRLRNNTDYIIIHDSERKYDYKYHYSTIYPLFMYKYDFQPFGCPFTTVLSNRKELSWLK